MTAEEAEEKQQAIIASLEKMKKDLNIVRNGLKASFFSEHSR